MSISELVNYIGAENIRIQWLTECFAGANWRNKLKATEVRFLTTEVQVADLIGVQREGQRVGMIIWLPKDKLAEAIKTEIPKP